MADFIFTEHASIYLSTARPLMSSVVKYLFLAFSSNSSSNESTGTKYYLLIYLAPFITNLQLLSFIFSPHLIEENYVGYEAYVRIFTLIRLDALCFYFGIEFPFFIFTCCMIILPFSAVVIQILRLKYAHKPPQKSVIKFTIKIPLIIIKRFMLPSMCCILLSHIKYSLFSFSTVKEYEGVSLSQLNYLPMALISIILLPLLYIISTAQTLFLYENDLTRYKESFFARSSSHVAMMHISFFFVLSIVYYFVREFGLWYFIIFFGASKVYNLYQYMYYLPFYQTFANILYGWSCLINAWSSFVLVISILLESSMICLFLILFVTPCFLVILHMITEMRLRYIANNYRMETCRTIYQAELLIRNSVRKLVLDQNHDDESYILLLSEVKDLYASASAKFEHEKLLHVWEALFYFQILKKPDLALIKLSRGGKGNTSLEGDFHTHRLKRKLLKNIKLSKDRQFISFLKTISQVKDCDLKACNYALDFCNELLSTKPNQKTLELLAFSLSKSNIEVIKIYDKLLTKFPKQGAVIKLYGTYLCDVVNDPRGDELLKSFKNLGLEDVIEEYFDYKWGLLVIAGESDKVGMIVHSNKQAADILNLPIQNIIGSSLRNFVPPPINNMHIGSIKNHLLYGSHNEISHNNYALFYNKDKFLVECILNVKTACWSDRPYFIANLKRCDGNREVVLYDTDNFKVHTCSQGFLKLVDPSEANNIEGKDLELLLPGIIELKSEKQNFQRFKYRLSNGKPVYLMFGSTTICSTTLNYIHIFDKASQTVVIMKDTLTALDNTSITSVRLTEDAYSLSKDEEETSLLKHLDFPMRVQFSPKSTQRGSVTSEHFGETIWRETENKMETLTHTKTIQSTTLQTGTNLVERISSAIMKQLKNAARRYSIFLIIITFIMITTCFSIVIIMTDYLDSDYNYENLKTIIYQRNNLSEVARVIRSLQLYNSGFTSNDEYYNSLMSEASILMKDLNNKFLLIKDHVEEIADNSQHDLFFNDIVPVYRYTNEKITPGEVNILNAMSSLVASMQNIMNKPITELYSTSEDFFFIYRNSPAEILNTLNMTATMLESKQLEQENEVLMKVNWIGFALVLVVGLLCIVLLLPNLLLMEKCNQQLWKSFNRIKLDMILQVRLKILQRLEDIHREEVACPEYSKDKRNNMPASKLCYRPLFYLAVYLGLSVAFIMLTYNLALKDFGRFLISYPPYVNWLAMSVVSTDLNFYWLRERCIQNTSESYFNIISSGQYWPSPYDRLLNSSYNLDYILDILISNPEKHGIYYLDQESKDLFLDTACDTSQSCPNSLLQYGIRSAVYKYKILSLYLQKAASSSSVDYALLVDMENTSIELKKALKDNLELYYDFTDSKKIEFLNIFLYGTIGFSILIIITVVFLLRPSIKKTTDKIQAIWHINKVFQQH